MRNYVYVLLLVLSASAFSQTHSGHGELPKTPKPTIKPTPQKKEPIKKDEARVPIEVPQEQQSKIGLKVAKAEKKKVEHTIRTVGTVTADQTKEAHVHTKING
ncbi:MAG: hypothetical protein IPM97_15065 [Bdellovibrionaceae bacterium]|nr:hypothetical protein [Pseudobdellovibrionaceae bacterium]